MNNHHESGPSANGTPKKVKEEGEEEENENEKKEVSYKAWPMGEFFPPPGQRRIQVTVPLANEHCDRYPSKEWTGVDGKPGKPILAAGLLAKADITSGSVIFLEQPIIFSDGFEAISDYIAKANKGEKGKRPTFMTNAWTMAEQLASVLLRSKIGGEEIWRYVWHHGKDEINSLPNEICREGVPILCHQFPGLPPATAANLLVVIHDTAIRMRTPLLGMIHGLGLYLLGATINHSCDPNCLAFIRDHESRMLVVKALRAIEVDEELTVAYEPSVCRFSKPEERQACLKFMFGFTCVCDRCRENPAVDQKMTTLGLANIGAFGKDTLIKIRTVCVTNVQGGPLRSIAILRELDSIWTHILGNGNPAAMKKMAPILRFELGWAYLSSLFIIPADQFSEHARKGLGLKGSLDLLDASIRCMEKQGYCQAAWIFSKPLLAFGTLVYNGALWPTEDQAKHFAFSKENVAVITECYKAAEEAVFRLYSTKRLLATDAFISEVVMEAGRRATLAQEGHNWLLEEKKKIDLVLSEPTTTTANNKKEKEKKSAE